MLAPTTNLEFMVGHTHTDTDTDTHRLPDLSVAAFENPFCGNMQLHVMFGPFWLPPRFAFISAVAAVAKNLQIRLARCQIAQNCYTL